MVKEEREEEGGGEVVIETMHVCVRQHSVRLIALWWHH